MCNLYALTKTRERLWDHFAVGHNRSVQYESLPAIFPGHVAPVVRAASDGERELVTMNWGFILLRPGYAPKRVTNTRDDKADTRFWKQSFEQRRCLVPATAFCEPQDGRRPATWHWFALKGDEPRPLFAFAGLWQRWRGPVKKDGPRVEQEVYSFMTTVPNALTASINHERSPVLLTTPEEHEVWIKGTAEQAAALVQPIAAERLAIVQEGFDKQDLVAVTTTI
jgi:putative SOS response-associated peptidase YedK